MNIPTPADPVMEMARKIGFDIWRERAERRYGKSINLEWVEKVGGLYRRGVHDDDPAVKGAAAAFNSNHRREEA